MLLDQQEWLILWQLTNGQMWMNWPQRFILRLAGRKGHWLHANQRRRHWYRVLDVRKILAEILAGVPDDEQAKIAGGNTARVYNFDVARLTVPA